MRKLDMNRLVDVEQMTLSEFHYKRYAQEYKEVDKEYEMHRIAFLTRNAGLKKTTGTGKNQKEEYIYKNFNDFFDYEKTLKSVDQEHKEDKKVSLNKRLSPAQIAAKRNGKG